MVNIAAIGSAIGGLKTAYEMAKAVQTLKTDTEVRQATSEMLDSILTARHELIEASATQAALLAQIKALEQTISDFEDWNGEKERYQLQAIDSGAFAYMVKSSVETTEPPHWLCTHCFEKRHKSILSYKSQDIVPGRGRYATWSCNTCKGTAVIHVSRLPSVAYETPPLAS
jgi:translation initiation factor 2B subunit (eIF-2B alpha/beta/delta family)